MPRSVDVLSPYNGRGLSYGKLSTRARACALVPVACRQAVAVLQITIAEFCPETHSTLKTNKITAPLQLPVPACALAYASAGTSGLPALNPETEFLYTFYFILRL